MSDTYHEPSIISTGNRFAAMRNGTVLAVRESHQACEAWIAKDREGWQAARQLAYSQGYDHGNYGSAYESQDWESWYADQCDKIPSEHQEHREAYEHGMLLGFFSSYEKHEIGDDGIAEQIAALRAQYGDE